MRLFASFFLLVVLIVAPSELTQLQAQSRKAIKAEAKAERVKKKQKKAYLASQEKDKKRRFEMQSPATKKRMKATRKDAKRINDQNHEPFLKKLFHRNNRKS